MNCAKTQSFPINSKIQKMNYTIKKSATIFFPNNTKRPRKYRSIYRTDKFEQFAKQSGGHYINYYNQSTGQYIERKYLT